MKNISWQILLGAGLLLLSALLHLLHYVIFHHAEHLFMFLIGDLAFLPIEVLFVSMILHRLLEHREKMQILNKMNMVIGAFFSEVGVPLLKKIVQCDADTGSIRQNLLLDVDWDKKNFKNAVAAVKGYDYGLEVEADQFEDIKQFIMAKRNFMLRLLENPILLENESFANLLWAVFHLSEELGAREYFSKESEADFKHLVVDLERIYRLLASEWIVYMQHLKNNYPYLYSFAVRTNPFNPNASAKIA